MNKRMNPSKNFGVLVGKPSHLVGSGVHQSYVGRAKHHQFGKVEVRLKVLNGKRLANELVASAVARYIGVNVPQTFLVDVSNYELEAQHQLDGMSLCLASQVVPNANDLRSSGTLANPLLIENFFATCSWQPVVALDALIANSDRTPANLLADESGTLWAIDHDTAFGGDWSTFDLVSNRHSTNLLARAGAPHPSPSMRQAMLTAWRSRRVTLPLKEMLKMTVEAELLSDEECHALSLYLERRWAVFDEVLRHALYNAY